MKTTVAVACLTLWLATAPLSAQPANPDNSSADPQVRAAQLEVQLANIRLGLAQVQAKMKAGQFPEAKQELASVQEAIAAVGTQTDLSAYKATADRLASDIDKKAYIAHRVEVARQYGDAPIPEGAFTEGQGYGNPKLTDPRQPGLAGQIEQAAEQVKLAEQNELANTPGSREEMTKDPAVIKQRTLDHQRVWDEGRYTPAKELIDVGKLLELDHERIMYQGGLTKAVQGSFSDQMIHVQEATMAPPAIMNFPSDWQQIKAARAKYADGKVAESEPFKDADGKTKTVAIYDVSDLLFVPIFPGPSEYNVNRTASALAFWAQQDRARDALTHPPYSGYFPGYNDALYGGPIVAPPPAVQGQPGQPGQPGAATAPGAAVPGNAMGIGGYAGYRVTDVIPSAYYYSYEADPLYQYRLAAKRAQLLNAVNQLLSNLPQE